MSKTALSTLFLLVAPVFASAQMVTSQPDPATRNGNVTTVLPKGFYAYGTGGEYKLVIRFGTYNAAAVFADMANGANNQQIFEKNVRVGTQGQVAYNGVQIVLVNAPANLVIRAELQKKTGIIPAYTVIASSDHTIP